MTGPMGRYDAGLLSDFGGGNVEWWQDYIRAELDRAHDFYRLQLGAERAAARNQALEEAAQVAGKRVSMAAGTAMLPSAVFNLFGSIPDAIRALKDKTE